MTGAAAVVVRLCKTSLVATVALFFILAAFGNITDYDTNWAFVQHVLAMDTILPGSTLTWRAATDPRLATLAYLSISTMSATEICEYPDSQKVGMFSEGVRLMVRTHHHLDYWDGEI